MLEFFKPFLALAIAATLAGFAVVLDGLARTGTAAEQQQRETHAVQTLAAASAMTLQSHDTLLDSAGTPHQIFRMKDKTGARAFIVRFKAAHGADSALYFVLADSALKPSLSVALPADHGIGSLFRESYAACAQGTFPRLRSDASGRGTAVSEDIAQRCIPLLSLAAAAPTPARGSHAPR